MIPFLHIPPKYSSFSKGVSIGRKAQPADRCLWQMPHIISNNAPSIDEEISYE